MTMRQSVDQMTRHADGRTDRNTGIHLQQEQLLLFRSDKLGLLGVTRFAHVRGQRSIWSPSFSVRFNFFLTMLAVLKCYAGILSIPFHKRLSSGIFGASTVRVSPSGGKLRLSE
jgi:hypothetical protein